MPTPMYDEKREKWTIRTRVILDGKIVNKRFDADKKSDCMRLYNDFMIEYEPEYQSVNVSSMTMNELINAYLTSNRQRWKPSSYYDLSNRCQKIRDFLGNKDARKIVPADIQAWLNSLSRYSYKYKTALRTLLSSIYKFGNRIYDIPDIMGKVDTFRDTSVHEINYWTPEEFQAFIAVVDPAYRLFFRFLYVSGCRKGEAMALSPSDVYADHVHISKSVTSKTSDRGLTVTTPKNRQSVRDVSMPVDILSEMKSAPGPFVFGGGRPYALRTLDRVFADGIRKAGVKKIRIHDLRHSCASLLISRGASIVAVSQRLGHKDTEMTLNTYSHLMPTEKDKVIAAFDGF